MPNEVLELHFLQHRDTVRVLGNASNGSYLAINRGKLTTYAYRLLKDWEAAEDAVQEAYCRALMYKGAYDSDRPFAGWYFITLTRLCLQARRNEGHVPEMVGFEVVENLDSEDHGFSASPEGKSVASSELNEVENHRSGLSERDRSVVDLYHFYQHTRPQVAAILGLGKRNVDRILYNFKKLLVQQ